MQNTIFYTKFALCQKWLQCVSYFIKHSVQMFFYIDIILNSELALNLKKIKGFQIEERVGSS